MIEPTDTADHPEELLSLALSGGLDEAQWRTLRKHLAACRPCSTQMRIAGWMNQDADSNLAASHMRDRMTLSRVMDTWERGNAPRRLPLVPRWVLLGSAALAISGAAIAGSWWSSRRAPSAANPTRSTPSKVSPTLVRPGASKLTPVETQAPIASATPTPLADSPATVEEPASKSPEPSESPEQPTAAVLFARASEQRLNGQGMAAIATFKRLQKLYPDSRESQTSHLLVGRVWLDNQRPELAAPEFASYLRSGGAANEEGLMGHATALRRMGQSSAEAADWQRLLDKYPRSLYAAEARARLAELGQPPKVETPHGSGRP